jgi:hypothetical protein
MTGMKMLRLVVAFLVVGLIGCGLGWWLQSQFGERITVARLSPDETFRASLSERTGTGRLFDVRIENLITRKTITVFRSPDEGGPYGSERLIWSKDGTKLLLVGRHFFVKEDLFLDNGDQLYFLYEVPTGRSWCNAEGLTGVAPLKAIVVEGIDFTEPVRLKRL